MIIISFLNRDPSLEWKYAVLGDFNRKIYLFSKEISETIMSIPIREWDNYFQNGTRQIYDEAIIFKCIYYYSYFHYQQMKFLIIKRRPSIILKRKSLRNLN